MMPLLSAELKGGRRVEVALRGDQQLHILSGLKGSDLLSPAV
jgi:hypothetical protein